MQLGAMLGKSSVGWADADRIPEPSENELRESIKKIEDKPKIFVKYNKKTYPIPGGSLINNSQHYNKVNN